MFNNDTPMIELAPDLYLIETFPKYTINAYLMGGVLVDAATRFSARNILRQLHRYRVTAHALTHVHPDHQGASKAVCEALGVPLWCGAAGVEAMESGNLSGQIPSNLVTRILNVVWAGPAYPVERPLREGDEVGGFTVIDAPGHAPSQVAFWRESDRTLILGDVLNHRQSITGRTWLRVPPDIFTVDPTLNRQSARKLAALRPNLVCFGHGPPLRDRDVLMEFVSGLE